MERIKGWFDNLSDALQAVSTIIGVATMLAIGWVVIWTWIKNWDWVQKGLMIFIGIMLVFLLLLAGYTWWRKTQIYQIPKLLYKLDGIMRDYVDKYEPNKATPSNAQGLASNLGELMHISIYPISNAFKNKNRSQIARSIESGTSAYNKHFNSLTDTKNKNAETLKTLMQISGLMNEHGIGLKIVQETTKYQDILKTVKQYERIVPNPEVCIKVNEYLYWADGLYSLLIGQKFVTSNPEIFALSPAEYQATASYSKPVTEGQTDTLIAAVAESLRKGKNKNEKETKS